MPPERQPPEDIGSEPLLSLLLLERLLPVRGRELEDATPGPRGEQAEEVAEVALGLDPVHLTAGQERHEDRVGPRAIVAADEEPVLGAPGKPGRGGRSWKRRSETFYGTQRVINPAREGLATHRKRVLRGQGATPAAKRRQRARGPCDGAPKGLFSREPTRLRTRKATPERRRWPGAEVPPGSENRARVHEGSPGTWEISLSPFVRIPGRGPR